MFQISHIFLIGIDSDAAVIFYLLGFEFTLQVDDRAALVPQPDTKVPPVVPEPDIQFFYREDIGMAADNKIHQHTREDRHIKQGEKRLSHEGHSSRMGNRVYISVSDRMKGNHAEIDRLQKIDPFHVLGHRLIKTDAFRGMIEKCKNQDDESINTDRDCKEPDDRFGFDGESHPLRISLKTGN